MIYYIQGVPEIMIHYYEDNNLLISFTCVWRKALLRRKSSHRFLETGWYVQRNAVPNKIRKKFPNKGQYEAIRKQILMNRSITDEKCSGRISTAFVRQLERAHIYKKPDIVPLFGSYFPYFRWYSCSSSLHMFYHSIYRKRWLFLFLGREFLQTPAKDINNLVFSWK